MNIPLDQAKRLFREANEWDQDTFGDLAEDSEIRKIAIEMFGGIEGSKRNLTRLQAVCSEIFRVIAVEAMRELPNCPFCDEPTTTNNWCEYCGPFTRDPFR